MRTLRRKLNICKKKWHAHIRWMEDKRIIKLVTEYKTHRIRELGHTEKEWRYHLKM
jgi:hypothetical protein